MEIGEDALEVIDQFLDNGYDYDKAYDEFKRLKDEFEESENDDVIIQAGITGVSSALYLWHLNANSPIPLDEERFYEDMGAIVDSRNTLAEILGEDERDNKYKTMSSTEMVEPTLTPSFSDVSEETTAKVPTNTPIPTQTQTLSETPAQVTEEEIPEPNVYDGSGDTVIELEPFGEAWVLYIKGNEESKVFAVTGYDENSKLTHSFASSMSPYEGIQYDPNQNTVLLEIKAHGDWYIEQRSIRTLDRLNIGETYSGSGDNVLYVRSYGKTAYIKGNDDEQVFAITSYGSRTNFMVSTTDFYEGQVLLKGDPQLIVVKSRSEWEITLEEE